MKRFGGWWFPDEEIQLPEAMDRTNVVVEGRLTWQYHKYAAACGLLPLDRRRLAVDVGAHIGLWSYWMARDFAQVVAFEPNVSLHDCFAANMGARKNVELLYLPLGANEMIGRIVYEPEKTGGGRLIESDPVPGSLIVMPLDSIELPPIDLLKIDVEGGEYAVVQGGERVIRMDKPIIILEVQQQDAPEDLSTVQLLESWGASVRTRLGNDVIMEWL